MHYILICSSSYVQSFRVNFCQTSKFTLIPPVNHTVRHSASLFKVEQKFLHTFITKHLPSSLFFRRTQNGWTRRATRCVHVADVSSNGNSPRKNTSSSTSDPVAVTGTSPSKTTSSVCRPKNVRPPKSVRSSGYPHGATTGRRRSEST